MKKISIILSITLCALAACNKSSTPAAASGAASPASSSSTPGPVQQKLHDYAGTGATNCGDLDVRAAQPQMKNASDCAMQASQGKHAFYISYEMPGMSVGVAGNAEGKLFTAQTQGSAAGSALSAGDCPSALRVASSGRVTCFAPGDMSSMSGSHTTGSVPSGMTNPHATGKQNPHATPSQPPANQL